MSVKATKTEERLTLHFAKDVTVDVQKVGDGKYRFTFEVDEAVPTADAATTQETPRKTATGNCEHHTELPLSEEALQFCRQNNLLEHVATAYAIALRSYPTVCDVEFRLQEEPGCEGIDIRLTVRGTEEEVLRWSSNCTDELIRSLPTEALGKISVTEGTI